MKKKVAPPPVSEINVTPMVDVMLVVLIIFMVITPMLNKGVPIDLAKTRNPIVKPDADKEDAVIVAVTRDGQVYLSPGVQKMKPSDLPDKVRDLIASRPDKTVYIRSDARAKYETVEEVVDNLRAAGIESLALLTEQSQERKTPAPASSGGGI